MCVEPMRNQLTSFASTGRKMAAVAEFDDTSVTADVRKQASIMFTSGGRALRPAN